MVVSRFTVLLIFAGLLALSACLGQNERAGSSPLQAAAEIPRRQIRSLDDPANPYISQYRDWDRWMFENIDARSDGTKGWQMAAAHHWSAEHGKEPTCWSMELDSDGWMVPVLQTNGEYQAGWARNESVKSDSKYWITALGDMPSEMREQMIHALDVQDSEWIAEIPVWIFAKNYNSATFLPNGWIVLNMQDSDDTSKPASHVEAPSETHSSGSGYIRGSAVGFSHDEIYDATGKLLFPAQGTWQMQISKFALEGRSDQSSISWSNSFQFTITDNLSDATESFDYDATPITRSDSPPQHDQRNFTPVLPELVEQYYNVRHSL